MEQLSYCHYRSGSSGAVTPWMNVIRASRDVTKGYLGPISRVQRLHGKPPRMENGTLVDLGYAKRSNLLSVLG